MDQRVLITAGASGIGREMARAFAANGAKLFVCDIDTAGLTELAEELPGLVTGPCDISRREEIEHMVAEAAQALGGIDVLINNAGIAGPTAPVAELDPDAWEKVLQVNLTGTFNVTRLAIPHLIRSGRGVVLNMSSAAGRFGYPNRGSYAASKWGVIGFTKSLSIELGEHGIRVNAILPGVVDGSRIQKVLEGRAQASGQTPEQVRQGAMANQSLDGFVDPRDIAALAVFLASDAGKSISGQLLPIDNDMQRL